MNHLSSGLLAVLLDRDGVINEEPGPVLEPAEFRMISGSAEAVARINEAGWLALIVTNQAALARGQMELKDFAEITHAMNRSLAEKGASVDGQYLCPHHPDWFQGKKLSEPGTCACRKPETGLLRRACGSHGVLPHEAVMIGDTSKDFEAAYRFGCPSIGVRTGHGGLDGSCDREPDFWFDDLAAAVSWLTSESSTKP